MRKRKISDFNHIRLCHKKLINNTNTIFHKNLFIVVGVFHTKGLEERHGVVGNSVLQLFCESAENLDSR